MSESPLIPFPIKSGNKYGWIRADGSWAIAADFNQAGLLTQKGQAAPIKLKGVCGTVNLKGEIGILNKADLVCEFSEGVAAFVVGRQQKYAAHTNEYHLVGGSWGAVDHKGTEIIPARFQDMGFCREGLIATSLNQNFGYLNRKGDWAMAPSFGRASDFHNGISFVRPKHQMFGATESVGAINKEGQEILPKEFSSLIHGPNQTLWARKHKDNFYTCYDSTGKKLHEISKEITLLSDSLEGLLLAYKGEWQQYDDGSFNGHSSKGSYGFITLKGNWDVRPKYKKALAFNEDGMAAVQNEDGKWGYINTKGKEIVALKYDSATPFYDGFGMATLLEKQIVFNNEGEIVWQS